MSRYLSNLVHLTYTLVPFAHSQIKIFTKQKDANTVWHDNMRTPALKILLFFRLVIGESVRFRIAQDTFASHAHHPTYLLVSL